MLSWLFIIILSYLFFSFSFFGDKLILSAKSASAALNPKFYTFWIGVMNILVIFLLQFTTLSLPSVMTMVWIIATSLVSTLGLWAMFCALQKFEVSRVMPTIGALQPIFVLLLSCLVWGGQVISGRILLAFTLLLFGSIIISIEKTSKITGEFLVLNITASFLFSLGYLFSKFVFLHQTFLQGLFWIGLSTFLFSLIFLTDTALRSQVFSKKATVNKKTAILFIFTQTAGGIANILQSLAIYLVPISYLAIANSLRGIQYIFLFVITIFFTLFSPSILKEEISKKVIIQKTCSVLAIILGLAILVIK